MKNYFFYLAFFLLYSGAEAQIFDVHLHSYTAENYFGGNDHPSGLPSPERVDQHLKKTIEEMDKHNIRYAVVSGSVESIEKYTKADPRFIPGYSDGNELIDINKFEELIKAGKIKVFGEVAGVYFGRTLNDPVYGPYLALCEKYGVPVAYHTGGGPPMTPYNPATANFRISLGDPLFIEDVLVRYPKLKVYLMHGGEMYFEHAVRMMSLYRHLYIDVGVLLWVDPIVKNYSVRLLKLAKSAGVLDRVMFGTDQMVWPGAISSSVDYLNSMDFLSEDEKKMIFYDNAIRFFGLGDNIVPSHTGDKH